MRNRLLLVLFLLLILVTVCGAQQAPADTVITHARVYTVDPTRPWAEAVAVRGGRIVFVGDDAGSRTFIGKGTRVIDSQGKLLLPGFEDSHVHFLGGSHALSTVDLDGAKTIPDVQARIRKFAGENPMSAWVQGRGWMYQTFAPEPLPPKRLLDAVVSDRPAIMSCADGHTVWVNTKALEIAGITKNTPDPKNGIIVRDANTGEPTGVLQEAATSLIWKHVPEPTRQEDKQALLLGLNEAARWGVVRVHSLGGDFEALDLLDEIRQEGKLTTRFSVALLVGPPAITEKQMSQLLAARAKYHDEWIQQGGVKMMLDGVIDSLTGAMIEPYTGQGDNRGKLFWNPDDYNKAVAAVDLKDIQVSTHAIGDLAIRTALNGYEYAAKQNLHDVPMRHKVEHVEDISAADISRFGKLGVIASFQPLHANPEPNWMGSWIAHVGPEREQRAFAWKAILSNGGRLAFGSDWPVVTINPWKGLQLAVTRQDENGQPPNGWIQQQRLTLEEAIRAYTIGGAYAMYREKDEGSIEPGKLADVVLLSQDIFKIDPHDIGKTTVKMTMVGGRIVYERQ